MVARMTGPDSSRGSRAAATSATRDQSRERTTQKVKYPFMSRENFLIYWASAYTTMAWDTIGSNTGQATQVGFSKIFGPTGMSLDHHFPFCFINIIKFFCFPPWT